MGHAVPLFVGPSPDIEPQQLTPRDTMELPRNSLSVPPSFVGSSKPVSVELDVDRERAVGTAHGVSLNVGHWRSVVSLRKTDTAPAPSVAAPIPASFSTSDKLPILRPSNRIVSDHLSHELLLLIIRELVPSSEDSQFQRYFKTHALAAAARISRSWNACATEVLYEVVELSNFVKCKRFLKTIGRNLTYARYVKVLVLPDHWPPSTSLYGMSAKRRKQQSVIANMTLVSDILSRCRNLERLEVPTTRDGPLSMLALPLSGGDNTASLVLPLSNLLSLHVSHHPSNDFSIRSPLPIFIEFTRLINLRLHRFVIWGDDTLPMIWPSLPCLQILTLEECFLHGEEVASLLANVRETIRVVRLINSIFAISVISDGLSAAAGVLEELTISERWGFDSVSEGFDRFSELKILRLEPANWSPQVYERLPPKLERLSIWASEDSFDSWRIVEDIIGFLQMDLPNVYPTLKVFELRAEASRFEPWIENLQELCDGHGIRLLVELLDAPSFTTVRQRRNKIRRRMRYTWNSLKRFGRMFW